VGAAGRTIVISTSGAPAGPGIDRSSKVTALPSACTAIGGMIVAKCAVGEDRVGAQRDDLDEVEERREPSTSSGS
jgi:hypothetical protein